MHASGLLEAELQRRRPQCVPRAVGTEQFGDARHGVGDATAGLTRVVALRSLLLELAECSQGGRLHAVVQIVEILAHPRKNISVATTA